MSDVMPIEEYYEDVTQLEFLTMLSRVNITYKSGKEWATYIESPDRPVVLEPTIRGAEIIMYSMEYPGTGGVIIMKFNPPVDAYKDRHGLHIINRGVRGLFSFLRRR